MNETVTVSSQASEGVSADAAARLAVAVPLRVRLLTFARAIIRFFLIRPLRYLIHYPGRALAVGMLVILISAGAGLAGIHLWAGYHFRAAQSSLERYRSLEAQTHLRACLVVWPRHAEGLLMATRAARRLEAFEEAEQFLDRYRAVRGEDDDLLLERVLLRAESGDVDQVSGLCRALVEQDHPATPLILEALAHSYMRLYRLGEAAACLKLWQDRQPDNFQAFFMEGLLHEQGGHAQAALESLSRAVRLDPEYEEARQHMAWFLVQQRRGEEALPHLEYLCQRQPDNLVIRVHLAQCRLQLGHEAEAVRILDAVLARQPDLPLALSERGKLAWQAGQVTEAETWLRQAAALQPGDYQTHYLFSQCLSQSGKMAEYKEELARVKQLEQDMRRLDQIVNGAMQQAPHNPALHYEAGMIALRGGAPADALRWWRNAIKEDPKYAPAHLALAYYYHQAGDNARATHHRQLARQATSAGTAATGADATKR